MIFDSAATLPNVIVTDTVNLTPTGNTSVFTFSTLTPPTLYAVLALQWKQKLDMDKHHSGGKIEFSIDSGQTWMNVLNKHSYTISLVLTRSIKILYGTGNTHSVVWILIGGIIGCVFIPRSCLHLPLPYYSIALPSYLIR